MYRGDWKDGSVAESTSHSSRGLGVSSQHLHDGSQLLLTPVPGDPMPSSYLCKHQACTWYTDIHETKYPHIYISVYVSTHTHTYTQNTYIYKYMYICVSVCVYIYIYIYIYIQIPKTHIHIYIYIIHIQIMHGYFYIL
jgi:hypothetical protein